MPFKFIFHLSFYVTLVRLALVYYKFKKKLLHCERQLDRTWCPLRVTTHLEKSGNFKVVRGKSGEVKSGVFFQALNTPKLVFRLGLCPDPAGGACDTPPDLLVSWGGGHPISFPQLLQSQFLNNWLSGLTLFFTNMKQLVWTISVNTRYRVIFACLYWKSRGISCGLESGHPATAACSSVYWARAALATGTC